MSTTRIVARDGDYLLKIPHLEHRFYESTHQADHCRTYVYYVLQLLCYWMIYQENVWFVWFVFDIFIPKLRIFQIFVGVFEWAYCTIFLADVPPCQPP